MDLPQPLDPAQLASLNTALDDLTRRVTAMADQLAGSPREDVAAALYEVERHLGAAGRRMDRIVRQG